MERYKNLSGRSSVESFEIGADYIAVKFMKNPKIYRYSYARPGMLHVEQMKRLASDGRGLGGYINSHPAVKHGFQ